jgi:hypothetical protein
MRFSVAECGNPPSQGMKAFLINLLILVAIALSGFNALQWYREARLHGDINRLGDEVYKRSAEIQSLQLNVKANLEEIKRLEGIRENFGQIVKSNRTVVALLEEQSEKFRRDLQIQTAKSRRSSSIRTRSRRRTRTLRRPTRSSLARTKK